MASVVPITVKPYYGVVSVDSTADILFDTRAAGAAFGGIHQVWEVHITNGEAAATDVVYIGFDSDVLTSTGYPIAGANGERVYMIPLGTVVYGVAGAARDVRILAIPRMD